MRGSPPHVRGKVIIPNETMFRTGITPACAGKRKGGVLKKGQVGDHPRMCGEKTSILRLHHVFQGSPPHVRGKVDEVLPGDTFDRITPACAGKSHQ